MNKQIEVRRGDEYCTKVSTIYAEEDFFYEAYSKAAQGVNDIIQAVEKFYAAQNQVSNVTEYMRLAGFPNNFIAFCAGRGQGKTSAMLSFSSALRELGRTSMRPDQVERFWGGKAAECGFYVLDPVDPTMMNQEDSILRIVISRMFERYAQEKERSCRRDAHTEKEPKLLGLFRKCYRSLDVLQKGRDLQDCYDDLEYLADLGDSSHMKQTFQELVSLFLDLIFPVRLGDNRKFLVIQLDDADLNASNSYRIVEELRKYCTVPNVIILMATDFKQLELTVEQHFIGELEMLCKYKKEEETASDHCHRMMERYLDKLIPGVRQVHLPLIDNYIRDYGDELELTYLHGDQKVISENYQTALLQMIYHKTGLILTRPEGDLHNLLPRSMRELTHLLAFLDGLPDIVPEDGAISSLILEWRFVKERGLHQNSLEALEQRRKNVDAFMLYLRHCWAKNALTEKQQAAVFPAMDATMDMKIQQFLNGLWTCGAQRPKEGDISYQYIDVIRAIDELRSQPDCVGKFNLIYISATMLTMYMHLLVLRDLEEGLKFERLKRFMGDGVFQPELCAFSQGGLRYDQWKLDHNIIPQLAGKSETMDTISQGTRTMVLLLLSGAESCGNGQGVSLDEECLGDQVNVLAMFKNVLERLPESDETELVTELLDIILSWDLQCGVSDALKKINKEDVPDYGTWLKRQLVVIDRVYEDALEELDIETNYAALADTLENQDGLLAALAMGREAYAEQWWNGRQNDLKRGLERAQSILNQVEEVPAADGEQRKNEIAQILVQCGQELENLNKETEPDMLLRLPALYNGGVTPQSVIAEACDLLRNPEENRELLENGGAQGGSSLNFLREKAGNITQIHDGIADCIKKLDEIKLYFDIANL